jgi:MOSC domain-containing protein YiiM
VFAERIGVPRWIKRFTERGVSGTYLRVVEPGNVRVGDPVVLLSRPEHTVTIGVYFRALTTEPALLPGLMAAGESLPAETRATVARRTAAAS